MKYIKTFENLNEPQFGDYVFCEEIALYQICDFTSKNVGRIVDIEDNKNNIFCYIVAYYDVPDNIKLYFDIRYEYLCRDMSIKEIKFWSKNKEDVELYIAEKKYNL